jgi:hypothetical protein
VGLVNTYDPMDCIVYRHLDARTGSRSAADAAARSMNELPSGYANDSPRTHLRRTGTASRAA